MVCPPPVPPREGSGPYLLHSQPEWGRGGDKIPSPSSTSPHFLPVAPAWIPDAARSQVVQQDQRQQLTAVCCNSSYRMKSRVQNDSGAGDSLSFFLEVPHSRFPLVLQHNLSAGARMLALESQSCFSKSRREPTHLSRKMQQKTA